MSDSPRSVSPWRRGWNSVRRYWHWPILLAAGIYLYQQYLPHIDLAAEGRPASDFAAETVEGNTFRLAEHRGEVVVVNVWATWCAPCRVEMPGFVDLQERFREEGVQFVGIAINQHGAAPVKAFAEREGLKFPQIANPALAGRYFPGEVVPRTYLIDKQGRIRYEHDGVILKWALDDALERLVDESSG